MKEKIPDLKKLSGLSYVFDESGLELPVLDVTHSAFLVSGSPEEIELLARNWADKQAKSGLLGGLVQKFVMPRVLKKSRIGQGLLAAKGGTLDALTTYLMKLGPQALGDAYATKVDKRIAASIASTLLRLRVRDLSEAQARALEPFLLGHPGASLQLVSIAGGYASDCLNTLRLLRGIKPDALAERALAGRAIQIHILDLNVEGPRFAGEALEAWKAEDGPLHGLNASLFVKPYDWSQSAVLAETLKDLPGNAVTLLSSEGGLFDYGTDSEILSNLEAIHAHAPKMTQVTGTLTRPEGPGSAIRQGTVAAVIPRDLESFQDLAQRAGWTLAEHWMRPTNIGFRLIRSA